jgi:malate synthase
MPGPNQLERLREEVSVTAADLLRLPEGVVTERGLRQNINVGILYVEAWLRGSGAVPLYNLMEDAATAEISRTQLWQWIHHGARLDDGTAIDAALYRRLREEELAAIRAIPGRPAQDDALQRAAEIFDNLVLSDELADFLTLPAYEQLLSMEQKDWS